MGNEGFLSTVVNDWEGSEGGDAGGGTPSRDLLERIARASGKNFGESSSVISDSVSEICRPDIAEVKRAFHEACDQNTECQPHCGPLEDNEDGGTTLSGDGGSDTGRVRTWDGGSTKGRWRLRLSRTSIYFNTCRARQRTVKNF